VVRSAGDGLGTIVLGGTGVSNVAIAKSVVKNVARDR